MDYGGRQRINGTGGHNLETRNIAAVFSFLCPSNIVFAFVLSVCIYSTFVFANDTPSPLRNQISAKKMIGGGVLNLFLSKDHKTTLTFCQVIILLYTSSRLTKSSTLLSAPVLASRIYTSPQ